MLTYIRKCLCDYLAFTDSLSCNVLVFMVIVGFNLHVRKGDTLKKVGFRFGLFKMLGAYQQYAYRMFVVYRVFYWAYQFKF